MSSTDAERPQPHAEDPGSENPYPTDHPGQRVWESATHEAEEDLFRFQQEMLERQWLSAEEHQCACPLE